MTFIGTLSGPGWMACLAPPVPFSGDGGAGPGVKWARCDGVLFWISCTKLAGLRPMAANSTPGVGPFAKQNAPGKSATTYPAN